MSMDENQRAQFRFAKIDQVGIRAFVRDEALARGADWADIIDKCGFAAFKLLYIWLGSTWVRRHLVDMHTYFSGREGPEYPPHYHARTLELAELLFNMQHVPGFEHRLKSMETDSVEGAIAELQGARFLLGNNVPFAFREPDQAGTYDIDAKLGGQLCVEMKGKMDGYEPTWQPSVIPSMTLENSYVLIDQL